MRGIVARATDRWRDPAGMPGIDMGDGRVLEAEDVLDTYSARLISVAPGARPTKTVNVQVDDNLVAAIEVLAPDLAKLTHLADEVAQAVPPVHPEAEFRQSLYEALERTHRQQAARRALGTHELEQPAFPYRMVVGGRSDRAAVAAVLVVGTANRERVNARHCADLS